MTEFIRILQTASLDLLSGSMIVSGGRIDATEGSVTGTFSGSASGISYQGTASFAPQSDFAQTSVSGTFAATASNVGPGGIISGAQLVVADVAPTVIGLNSTIGSFTNLTGIDETISELGGGLTRLKLNLEDFNEARVSVATDSTDDKGAKPQLAAQWSLNQTIWDFFASPSESAGAFLTQSNTVAESTFTGLVSESKTDVFVRIVTYNGPPTGSGASAKIGSIFIQFR